MLEHALETCFLALADRPPAAARPVFPAGPSRRRNRGHLWQGCVSDGDDEMTARSMAGMMLLTTVLSILWLKASTAWLFTLFR
jgi:hypothetical protein